MSFYVGSSRLACSRPILQLHACAGQQRNHDDAKQGRCEVVLKAVAVACVGSREAGNGISHQMYAIPIGLRRHVCSGGMA